MSILKRKIIVKLRGGLGNQMFQYVFARYCSKSFHNKEIYIDISPFRNLNNDRKLALEIFNLSDKIKKIDLSNFFNNKLLENKNFVVRNIAKTFYLYGFGPMKYFLDNFHTIDNKTKSSIEGNKTIMFDGYWQNLFYLNNIESFIKKEFSIKKEILDLFYKENNESLKLIQKFNKICIHIRRTDYTNRNSLHINYGIDYYKNALTLLPLMPENTVYIIFSDDIKWCKKEINFIKGKVIFCDNVFLTTYSDVNNFILMSLCDHFIIPNSTYSFWAAYLSNNNSKVVIVPKKWLNSIKQPNIIPYNWISI